MAPVKRFNALIVDNDSKSVANTTKYLSRNGFHVKIANNGQEAIEFFQRGNHFDLVLMDMEMPIIDGFQATREIRALGVRTLMIGLSVSSSPTRIQEFLSAGLDEFYAKPMNMAKLAAIMGHFN
ncbi:Two-component response regulator 24 [Bienertia sinuspersici]